MVTVNENGRMRSRPMHVAQVEEDCTCWFFTDEYSGKVETLKTDHPVVLDFSDCRGNCYLTISGRAYLVDNKEKMAELWNPVLNAWFPGGLGGHFLMIKVAPEMAEYWEEPKKSWKQVFYAGKAFLTGEDYSLSEHERVAFQQVA